MKIAVYATSSSFGHDWWFQRREWLAHALVGPGQRASERKMLKQIVVCNVQGVLFFELFNPVMSASERMHALSGLRHRILPIEVLQGRPQEAAFVLSLLHPDPSARPTAAQLMRPECLTSLQRSICKQMVREAAP